MIAATTCGRKSAPYCVLERSYSAGSVRIVLAAGNVTSAIPCTIPAAYTTVVSFRVAIERPPDSLGACGLPQPLKQVIADA